MTPLRNIQIDFTKGSLVIAMAIYHTLNYTLEGNSSIYGYVAYVSEAFIYYSGFICGTIYLEKYLINKSHVINKLLLRSIKLFIIFIALNIAILSLTGTRGHALKENGITLILCNIYSIFIVGNDDLMAFEILLPISYLLAICSILLNTRNISGMLLILLLLVLLNLGMNNIHIGYNAKAIMIGLGGFYTGLISLTFSRYTHNRLYEITIFIMAFLYFTIFVNSGYRLSIFYYYLLINIVIALLHITGRHIDNSNILAKNIAILGQYSLFLYLLQILYLQIITRIFPIRSDDIRLEHVIVFIALNIISIAICYILASQRSRIHIIDRFYRFIFL